MVYIRIQKVSHADTEDDSVGFQIIHSHCFEKFVPTNIHCSGRLASKSEKSGQCELFYDRSWAYE